MKTFIWIVFICVIIGVGGYFLYTTLTRPQTTPIQEVNVAQQPQAPLPSYEASDFHWSLQNAPGATDTDPRQFLSIVVKDRTISLGQYRGCSEQPSQATLEPGEITRETCWYAGAGNDISVFKESDGRYVVKARFIQETDGESSAPSSGPFQKLTNID